VEVTFQALVGFGCATGCANASHCLGSQLHIWHTGMPFYPEVLKSLVGTKDLTIVVIMVNVVQSAGRRCATCCTGRFPGGQQVCCELGW
jgi:hypothetical protein